MTTSTNLADRAAKIRAIYARRDLHLELAEAARGRGQIDAAELDTKWEEYRAEERRLHVACKAEIAELAD
jgi:hypothetical protein